MHVGSTYAEVMETYPHEQPGRAMHGIAALRITGPQGAVVSFYFRAMVDEAAPETPMVGMQVSAELALEDFGKTCD